jgi:hypothetical protein
VSYNIITMKPRSSRRSILVKKFIDFYHRYETVGLKITFILISLQIIHLYWLTTDVVLQKIFGQSFFLVPRNLLPLFVVIDYIEIPALVSGIIFYIYSIRSDEDSKKSYLFLGLLGVQVIHIFWITDDVVYSSFFKSSFVQIPSLLAWIAILIDYLELPVIGDLFYKIIKKKRR